MELINKRAEYGYNFAEYFKNIHPGDYFIAYHSVDFDSFSFQTDTTSSSSMNFDVFIAVSSKEVFKYHVCYYFNKIRHEELLKTYLYTSLLHSYNKSTSKEFIYKSKNGNNKLITKFKDADEMSFQIIEYLLSETDAFPIIYNSGIDLDIQVSSKVLIACKEFDFNPYSFLKDQFKSNFSPSILRKTYEGNYENLNNTIVFDRFIFSFYKVDDKTICIDNMIENNKFNNKNVIVQY